MNLFKILLQVQQCYSSPYVVETSSLTFQMWHSYTPFILVFLPPTFLFVSLKHWTLRTSEVGKEFPSAVSWNHEGFLFSCFDSPFGGARVLSAFFLGLGHFLLRIALLYFSDSLSHFFPTTLHQGRSEKFCPHARDICRQHPF